MDLKEKVKSLASEEHDKIRETFEYIHAHPELSFEEYKTAEYIREQLKEMGIELQEGISETSTVGILKGSEPGPTIAWRADIDALPVEENNDLPYKSTCPGVMHACGHDSHTATLLSLARILSSHKELVKGTVKFMFQRAEEKLPGGAIQMVKEGAVDDADMVFGFHSAAGTEVGSIAVNKGPMCAAIAQYEVQVHGEGGHGSAPHTAKNPVPVASMIAVALNQLLSEKIDPLQGAVFTVAYIEGGKYPNIICSDVKLGGNIRVLDNSIMDKIIEEIQKISTGICEAYGLTCTFDILKGYPALINADEPTEIVETAISELGYNIIHPTPSLGGEDFSYFAIAKPSCYFQVGHADPSRPVTSSPHHSSTFEIDERMLDIALECELATYLKATKQA